MKQTEVNNFCMQVWTFPKLFFCSDLWPSTWDYKWRHQRTQPNCALDREPHSQGLCSVHRWAPPPTRGTASTFSPRFSTVWTFVFTGRVESWCRDTATDQELFRWCADTTATLYSRPPPEWFLPGPLVAVRKADGWYLEPMCSKSPNLGSYKHQFCSFERQILHKKELNDVT